MEVITRKRYITLWLEQTNRHYVIDLLAAGHGTSGLTEAIGIAECTGATKARLVADSLNHALTPA